MDGVDTFSARQLQMMVVMMDYFHLLMWPWQTCTLSSLLMFYEQHNFLDAQAYRHSRCLRVYLLLCCCCCCWSSEKLPKMMCEPIDRLGILPSKHTRLVSKNQTHCSKLDCAQARLSQNYFVSCIGDENNSRKTLFCFDSFQIVHVWYCPVDTSCLILFIRTSVCPVKVLNTSLISLLSEKSRTHYFECRHTQQYLHPIHFLDIKILWRWFNCSITPTPMTVS